MNVEEELHSVPMHLCVHLLLPQKYMGYGDSTRCDFSPDVFSKETLCCTQCARVWQSLDVSKTSLGEAVI